MCTYLRVKSLLRVIAIKFTQSYSKSTYNIYASFAYDNIIDMKLRNSIVCVIAITSFIM